MKRRWVGDLLVAMAAIAVVSALGTHGIGGWKLDLIIAALLVVYFRPRGDPAEKRERRIERQSNRAARMIVDTVEILGRASDKAMREMKFSPPSGLHGPEVELPPLQEPADLPPVQESRRAP